MSDETIQELTDAIAPQGTQRARIAALEEIAKRIPGEVITPIEALQEGLEEEIAQREAGDTTLTDALAAETSARTAADSAEALARISGDAATLAAAGDLVEAEATAREEADDDLQEQISVIEAGMGDALATYIYPEQYGAVGDGTTDDTDAVQQAIDESASTGTPVGLRKMYAVNVPDGDYLALHIPSNAKIFGFGPQTGFKLLGAATRDVRKCAVLRSRYDVASNDVHLRNFTLDCNWNAQPRASAWGGNAAHVGVSQEGILLTGSGILIDTIHIKDIGSVAGLGDSWGVLITLAEAATASTKPNIIRNCTLSFDGIDANLIGDDALVEGFMMWSTYHEAETPATYDAGEFVETVIEGCDVREPAGLFNIHGFFAGVVRNNSCKIAKGSAIYHDSWFVHRLGVFDNNFDAPVGADIHQVARSDGSMAPMLGEVTFKGNAFHVPIEAHGGDWQNAYYWFRGGIKIRQFSYQFLARNAAVSSSSGFLVGTADTSGGSYLVVATPTVEGTTAASSPDYSGVQHGQYVVDGTATMRISYVRAWLGAKTMGPVVIADNEVIYSQAPDGFPTGLVWTDSRRPSALRLDINNGVVFNLASSDPIVIDGLRVLNSGEQEAVLLPLGGGIPYFSWSSLLAGLISKWHVTRDGIDELHPTVVQGGYSDMTSGEPDQPPGCRWMAEGRQWEIARLTLRGAQTQGDQVAQLGRNGIVWVERAYGKTTHTVAETIDVIADRVAGNAEINSINCGENETFVPTAIGAYTKGSALLSADTWASPAAVGDITVVLIYREITEAELELASAVTGYTPPAPPPTPPAPEQGTGAWNEYETIHMP
jgi:hypothetical protein